MSWTDFGKEFLAQCTMGETDLTTLTLNIKVGDDNTAFDVTQTDLQGINTAEKGMISGFPTRTGNEIQLSAEFLRLEANFDWLEWGIFDDGGNMYYRKVEDNGIKQNDENRVFNPIIKAG